MVEAANAKLESAKLSLESTQIVSPLPGRVGRTKVSEGSWVLPGTTMVVILSLNPIHVSFDMDARQYFQFSRQWRQAGEYLSAQPPRIPVKVGLSIEEGFPHEGVVDFVDNQFDPKTDTIRVRAVLPNTDRLMLPGLFVRVRLPLETPRKP